MIDRKKFFACPELLSLFRGDYSPTQFDGLNRLLDEAERRQMANLHQVAYPLATAHHETGRKMQPIDEFGGPDYFFRMYDPEGKRPDFARQNGNLYPGDGILFHGRGFVQLTWRSNYLKMSKYLGVDLIAHPDKAKEKPYAEMILFEGMIRGSFTGQKLDNYFNATKNDPERARQIINGMDRSALVASYHDVYLEALS